MELKEFVSSTLQQICAAITDAQSSTNESGAVICPRCQVGTNGLVFIASDTIDARAVSKISFDIALTVSTSDKKDSAGVKKASLQVASFKAGIEGSTGENQKINEQASLSRVQFELHVVWPLRSADSQVNAPSPRQPEPVRVTRPPDKPSRW